MFSPGSQWQKKNQHCGITSLRSFALWSFTICWALYHFDFIILFQPCIHGCLSNTIQRPKWILVWRNFSLLAVSLLLFQCILPVATLSNGSQSYIRGNTCHPDVLILHAGYGGRVGAFSTELRRHHAKLHHQSSLQEKAQEARGKCSPRVTNQTWQTETVDQEEIIEEKKTLIRKKDSDRN